MADFGLSPIGTIKQDNEVFTLDLEAGRLVPALVERRLDHTVTNVVAIHFADGEVVYTTPEHRFLLSNGRFASNLSTSNQLRTYDNRVAKIAKIESHDGQVSVHNLVLKGGRNYLVGQLGVVAHLRKNERNLPIEQPPGEEEVTKPVPRRGGRPPIGPQPSRQKRSDKSAATESSPPAESSAKRGRRPSRTRTSRP
jgi:hypothetical protein